MGETCSENPTCLAAGSGEVFLMQFELISAESELLRRRTEEGRSPAVSQLGAILSPRSIWQRLETFGVVTNGVWGRTGAVGK